MLHQSDDGGIERNPFLSGNVERNTRVSEQQNFPVGGAQHDTVGAGGFQPTPRRTYQYPTQKESEFATAMSRIACHTDLASKGSSLNLSDLRKDLNDQLQLALAVKMGLNGSQQINERALYNVVTSQSARGDLKQVLRARAELYGEMLEAKSFKRNFDLGGKTKSSKEKRQARTMLAAAPLLVAQIGAQELRNLMMDGEPAVLQKMRLSSWGTAAQFLKALGKASPMDILRLCNKEKGLAIGELFLQHAEDLDFVQNVLNATAYYEGLNPVLNAILDAFARRKQTRRFKSEAHSLEVDTLRHSHTASTKYSDKMNDESSGTREKNLGQSQRRPSNLPCRFYQRGFCHFER